MTTMTFQTKGKNLTEKCEPWMEEEGKRSYRRYQLISADERHVLDTVWAEDFRDAASIFQTMYPDAAERGYGISLVVLLTREAPRGPEDVSGGGKRSH